MTVDGFSNDKVELFAKKVIAVFLQWTYDFQTFNCSGLDDEQEKEANKF